MKKIVLYFLLLLLLGTVVYAGAIGLRGGDMELRGAVLSRGPISSYVSATGTVISRDELTINSPVGGRLSDVMVNEGDDIGAGHLLAKFDAREQAVAIEKLASTLRSAKERSEFAVRDLDSLRRVYQVGGESRRAVDDAELRVATLREERTMAEQSLRQAQLELEKLTLTAPKRSVVTARLARPGVWVRTGDPLFKLAPIDTREIEAKLDASDSAIAVVGKVVTVSSDAYPDKKWQETITWVSPSTSKDGTANNLSARISLGAHAPHLALGQQVDVKLTIDSANNALLLPSNAIIANQGQAKVAVLESGRIHWKPVTTGVESVSMTEIKSGLTLGEKVVVPEGRALREGDRARFAGDVR